MEKVGRRELTESELAEMADDLAELIRLKENLTTEKAAQVKEYNSEISDYDQRISELAKRIRKGHVDVTGDQAEITFGKRVEVGLKNENL